MVVLTFSVDENPAGMGEQDFFGALLGIKGSRFFDVGLAGQVFGFHCVRLKYIEVREHLCHFIPRFVHQVLPAQHSHKALDIRSQKNSLAQAHSVEKCWFHFATDARADHDCPGCEPIQMLRMDGSSRMGHVEVSFIHIQGFVFQRHQRGVRAVDGITVDPIRAQHLHHMFVFF